MILVTTSELEQAMHVKVIPSQAQRDALLTRNSLSRTEKWSELVYELAKAGVVNPLETATLMLIHGIHWGVRIGLARAAKEQQL